MAAEPENLTLLTLRDIRRELAEHRTLMMGLVDQGRRRERRVSELRDELELTIKMEIMSRLTHFETRLGDVLNRRLDEAPRPMGPAHT